MKKKMVWLGMAAAALLAAGGSAFAQEGGTKEVTDVLDRTITLPRRMWKRWLSPSIWRSILR